MERDAAAQPLRRTRTREQYGLEDKLAKLGRKAERRVEGSAIVLERRQAAIDQTMPLAGC